MVFGAHGQLVVGVVAFLASVAVWWYGSKLHGAALIRLLYNVSMAALVLAAYAIVATALGYRATERVEAQVVENVEHADVVGTDG